MRYLRAVVYVALSALAAGCGAAGGLTTPSHGPAPAHARATVRITIHVPKGHRRRHGRYVSPFTKSMTIAFKPVTTGTTLSQTIDLTPTTEGCVAVEGGTLCTRTLTLQPAQYKASVTTYDGLDAGGNALSAKQNAPLTVVAGRVNHLSMTLNGIPHAIEIAGLTPGLHGLQSSGFTLYGNAAQQFAVYATDADSNWIVGQGAPTLAFSIGSGWTAPTPAPGTPNTLNVTPPSASGLSTNLHVSATFADRTCKATGAVCSADASITHHLQNVWVLGYGSNTIDEYAYPYTRLNKVNSISDPGANIGGANQNPQGFAMDSKGDIFVANCSATCGRVPADSVTEYDAPGYTLTQTITVGIADPETLSFDSANNLYVANLNGSVTVYPPPYTTTSPVTITTGIQNPNGLGFDSADNLYVLNCQASCGGTVPDSILQYAKPYTGMPVTIGTIAKSTPLGMPAGAFIVDSDGDVFAGSLNAVTEYPSGSSAATTMSTSGVVQAIALDGSNNLFAANCATCPAVAPPGSDSLLEFAVPYTAAATTIDSNAPSAVAVDAAGNLVTVGGDGYLRVYAWPYNTAAQLSAQDLSGPVGLIFTP